jgi:hypothetical protein
MKDSESSKKLVSSFTAEDQPQYRVVEIKDGRETVVLSYEEVDELREWLGKTLPAHEPRTVTRYEIGMEGDICGAVLDINPHPNGEWVRYEDVATQPPDVVRDAERYRWLRDFGHTDLCVMVTDTFTRDTMMFGVDLDSAIDAARTVPTKEVSR